MLFRSVNRVFEILFKDSVDGSLYGWSSFDPSHLDSPIAIPNLTDNNLIAFIRLKKSGNTPAGMLAKAIPVEFEGVINVYDYTLEMIDYENETMTVPQEFLYYETDGFFPKGSGSNGVIPVVSDAVIYVGFRESLGFGFYAGYILQLPSRSDAPSLSWLTVAPGNAPGKVRLTFERFCEYKVVVDTADADATGDDVIQDWTPADGIMTPDFQVVSGYKIYLRIPSVRPDNPSHFYFIIPGAFASLPSEPYVIRDEDIGQDIISPDLAIHNAIEQDGIEQDIVEPEELGQDSADQNILP